MQIKTQSKETILIFLSSHDCIPTPKAVWMLWQRRQWSKLQSTSTIARFWRDKWSLISSNDTDLKNKSMHHLLSKHTD